MSKIIAKINENILTIKKERTRVTKEDIEEIDIFNLIENKIYESIVKISNNKSMNKIFLLEKVDIEGKEKYILVYSTENKLYYELGDKEFLYKRLIKLPYKVLKVKLGRKNLKFTILAYVLNKYNLKINNIYFSIDSNNQVEAKLNQSKKEQSKLKMIIGKNVFKFKMNIYNLLESNEEINNYVTFIIEIDGTKVKYKIGIRDKKLPHNSKYYNLPMQSKYIKDFAIHIRRTIASNLIVVKRKKEPVEDTVLFRIKESKIVSAIMYKIGKLLTKHRKRKINIFYEKFASKSEEGVYELFLKTSESKNTKNYFVIDGNSPDYERIQSNKNVIKKYTWKYYWIIYNASNFIATEAPSHLNILRSNNKYFRKATYDKDFIFLQHGIIYMKNLGLNSSFKVGKEGEGKYIVVSSEKEKDVVVDMLNYREEQILKTGLGILGKLKYKHINQESDDIITIMFTWKPYEESFYNFEESSYYKNVVELYNSLKKIIDSKNIIIIAHPKVMTLIQGTHMKDSVWNRPISEALEKTKLFITDYSSACYNAFYQGAGVIFFQPDLEIYEKENGKLIPNSDEYIGNRFFKLNDLEKYLNNVIKNKQIDLKNIRNEEFEKNYATINEFSDGKNLDRIFNELQKRKII